MYSEIDKNKSRLKVFSGLGNINTYDLIDKMHLGVVFSSTIGLEMAMLGKKVLLGSEVYYSKKGFTIDSNSKKDYLEKLDLNINSPKKEISLKKQKLAQFYHFLLHSTLMPYPFDKPSGIQKINATNFFKKEIINQYKYTFESLTLTELEWKKMIRKNINENKTFIFNG